MPQINGVPQELFRSYTFKYSSLSGHPVPQERKVSSWQKTLPSRRKSGREQTSAGLSRLAVPGRLPQLSAETAHRSLRRTSGAGAGRTPSQSVCGKRPAPRHPSPQKEEKVRSATLFRFDNQIQKRKPFPVNGRAELVLWIVFNPSGQLHTVLRMR